MSSACAERSFAYGQACSSGFTPTARSWFVDCFGRPNDVQSAVAKTVTNRKVGSLEVLFDGSKKEWIRNLHFRETSDFMPPPHVYHVRQRKFHETYLKETVFIACIF